MATVNVNGIGAYSGTARLFFKIQIGATKKVTCTNVAAGQMTVTYDKCSGSTGYVVRYGLKSDMSDARVITVAGANTLSRTFSGMKKGKLYYVQVRTYKLDNSARYYSGYCTTKTITIKR